MIKKAAYHIARIFSSSGFKKYFSNTSWMMVGKILGMLVNLFVGIYVARYLGPEKFGIFRYSLSFVALFHAFASLGLDRIVVRNLIQEPIEKDNILGTSFILKVFGTVVLFVLVFLGQQLASSDKYTVILVLIIAGGMIFDTFRVIDFYFQSKVKARFSVIANIYAILGASITKIILIFVEAELVWFALSTVLQHAIQAFLLILVYRKQKLSLFRWKFKWIVCKNLLKDSWPLLLSGLAIMVYMRIDQIMIKEMLGSEAVGNYAAAVRLSEVWYFIPIIITDSIFPAIINAKKISETLYFSRLKRLLDLMLWVPILIALPITFISKKLIILLYGGAYSDAGNVLSIHIWSGVFVFLGVTSGKYLIAENLTKISFIRTFLGCVINIISNAILINSHGINGAAWATLLSYAIANFSLFISRKGRRILGLMVYSIIPFSRKKLV